MLLVLQHGCHMHQPLHGGGSRRRLLDSGTMVCLCWLPAGSTYQQPVHLVAVYRAAAVVILGAWQQQGVQQAAALDGVAACYSGLLVPDHSAKACIPCVELQCAAACAAAQAPCHAWLL